MFAVVWVHRHSVHLYEYLYTLTSSNEPYTIKYTCSSVLGLGESIALGFDRTDLAEPYRTVKSSGDIFSVQTSRSAYKKLVLTGYGPPILFILTYYGPPSILSILTSSSDSPTCTSILYILTSSSHIDLVWSTYFVYIDLVHLVSRTYWLAMIQTSSLTEWKSYHRMF